MGLRIRTNIASQMVQRNLKNTSQLEAADLERLSSGKRITKAADDAAGLAIATRLEATTKGLRQATRNANDGVSLIQTAEGGLSEISNILIRLRELTIQSSSDTVGNKERSFLNNEYEELSTEINRISESTIFNGTNLLKGEADILHFHVGSDGGDSNRIAFDAGETNATTDNIGLSGSSVTDKDSAMESIGSVDEAIDQISGQRAKLGAIQSRLQSTINNLEVQTINQDNARSVIQDVDVAQTSASLASTAVLKSAGIATLSQANVMPNAALRLIG
jgi:flagellin